MISRKLAFLLVLVCGVAVATLWGPFYIGSLGSAYAQTTLSADAGAEYEGANKIAQVYLAPALNTVAKISKALKEDYVRVVYYDGQIADFKVKRWPSTIPLDFDKTVATVDTPHVAPGATALISGPRCYVPGEFFRTLTYNTGYWGQTATATQNVVTIVATWVDTGFVSVTAPIPMSWMVNAHMCP